jgi:general secretion pathway protein D
MKMFRAVALLVACGLLVGCAADKAYRRAESESQKENWDQAVLGYSKAVALDPGNTRYSVSLERARLKASAVHFEKGKRYASASQWELAIAEYQQTLLLNPGNQHAATELERATIQLQRRNMGPSEIERLKAKAKKESLAPPKLSPRSNIPILLQFREQPIGKIFEAIGKASGINFIFDDKTDLTKPMTVDIGNVTLDKALDILMLQTKNFYKVIDDSTLLVAPDNRQKRQELEDQVIRTFYLSNGEVKQVQTLLRTLLNTRQIAENDPLNSVTIKDTPDKVAIAEKIIEANDKAKGEIVIDVELLEINRTIARTLGIDLSSKTLSATFRDGKQSVPLNNLSILKQAGNWLVGTIPSVVLNFLKSDSDSRSLAKPQLRVTEGEKAEILIGQRIPIPTTSFNTSSTVGGNIVPLTSYTYQNVGITVQIEPRVHHNKEVTLKIDVEVSNVAGVINVIGQGGAQPIIGTRNIKTVIRLRDGETNLLAGLIKRDDSSSQTGVAGLSEIPGLGKVFSNNDTSRSETDLILTLTPYILRIPDITESDLMPLWVGTEDNMRLRLPARNPFNQSPFSPTEEGAAEGGAAAAAPATTAPSGTTPGGTAYSSPTSGSTEKAPGPGTSQQQATPPPGEVPGGGGTNPPEETPQEPPPPAQEKKDPPPPAVVRLIPSAPAYKVGDRVVVEVRIENGTGVGSVPFHLRYNRQALEFVPPGIQGPFLGSDGTGTVFLANDAAGGGEVVVGLSRLGGGEGVNGSGILSTFQFQAVGPGDCGFAFTGASVKDGQARNLPSTFLTAAVQVQP